MLHEHSEVNLAKESITLITGANGSGKTQILDGIIICIGHIPARAKAKGIGSLVGKNGKHAKVILELANPIIGERRAITTMDKDLNSAINSDRFTIGAKISRDESTISYSLNNSRTIIRGRQVTRRDIRRIFESIGVRGDNRLAFTGEGTVDEFASKSAKRKLDVLLEVTGLKQYREEVIASQETLRASIQEIEPLKRKLETEDKLLNLWNDALNILKQKKKLMIMKTKLRNELAWSHVLRLEKRVETLNKERLKVIKQRRDNETAIQKKDEEILVLRRKLNSLEDELGSFEEQQRVKNRQIITLETQLENNNDNISSFKKEIDRYQEQKDQLDTILQNKDLSAKDRKIQDKQEALAVKLKKLSLIQEKCVKVENELRLLRKQIVTEPEFDNFTDDEEIFTGKRLTKYEEEMVHASSIFSQKIKKLTDSEEITGPIISLIKIKEGQKSWEKAVKNLLGRNLYAFIAKSDDAYRLAKRIYDETWPRWKPPLSVFKVTADDAQKANTTARKPEFKEIYDIATNLIDGDPYAVGFLKRVSRNALAEDKYDPNSLTNIAKMIKTNILTKSGKSYYLYHGGFGRPPAPINNPMGYQLKLHNVDSGRAFTNERKIRVEIAKLEKERRDFKFEEIQTMGQISKLHQETQALGLPDEKIIGKIETINEMIANIEAKVAEFKTHSIQLESDLKLADDGYRKFANSKGEITSRIDEIEEAIELLKIEQYSLKEKGSRLLTLELNYDAEYEEFIEEKRTREVEATNSGERPEEIRNYSDIRDELNRIEGHLESIGISNVDEEKIDAQKAKVESLKVYMTEREEHITRLRADLEARLAFWNGELQEIITNISRAMKLLLGGIFDKIRLKVTDINKPEEAGLYIEAITKGEAYRDFRELSGGEKVLAIEGLILAMHTLTDSPIHAIDEFTQRLDEKNKALAFSIAVRTQKLAGENSRFVSQFILLCPEALDVKLSEDIHHIVVSELKVMKIEH